MAPKRRSPRPGPHRATTAGFPGVARQRTPRSRYQPAARHHLAPTSNQGSGLRRQRRQDTARCRLRRTTNEICWSTESRIQSRRSPETTPTRPVTLHRRRGVRKTSIAYHERPTRDKPAYYSAPQRRRWPAHGMTHHGCVMPPRQTRERDRITALQVTCKQRPAIAWWNQFDVGGQTPDVGLMRGARAERQRSGLASSPLPRVGPRRSPHGSGAWIYSLASAVALVAGDEAAAAAAATCGNF